MMRGCPIRIEQPALDESELAESRERVTLPAPAPLPETTPLPAPRNTPHGATPLQPPTPATRPTDPAPADDDAGRLGRWHDQYAAWSRLDPERQTDAKVLTASLAHLGPIARAILLTHSERLRNGAIVYQRDFDGGENWLRELLAELLDAENYTERALQLKSSARVRTIRELLAVITRLAVEELAEGEAAE